MRSTRSHVVFTIYVESRSRVESSEKVAKWANANEKCQRAISNFQSTTIKQSTLTAFIPFQLLWIIHKPSYRYRKDQFFLGCWFERLCAGHFFETAFGGSCWEWAGQEVPWPWMIGHTMRIHDLVKSWYSIVDTTIRWYVWIDYEYEPPSCTEKKIHH